jgi:hypothetical protein
MDELSILAEKHKTDKGMSLNGYTSVYNEYFKHLRNDKIVLLELGVGGYGIEPNGGNSLKMWADYFLNGAIHGIDLFKKTIQGRFQTHKISQDDSLGLNKLIKKIGCPNIIIDDASHVNSLTIKSFEILFPLLKSGGIYVIEDTKTSYVEQYGGNKDICNLENKIIINYFLYLCHAVQKIIPPFDIISIHFYENLIFIKKK